MNVVETAAVGSLFVLPGAADADSRQFGVHEYQLRTDSTPSPPFDLKVWHNSRQRHGGWAGYTPPAGQVL